MLLYPRQLTPCQNLNHVKKINLFCIFLITDAALAGEEFLFEKVPLNRHASALATNNNTDDYVSSTKFSDIVCVLFVYYRYMVCSKV